MKFIKNMTCNQKLNVERTISDSSELETQDLSVTINLNENDDSSLTSFSSATYSELDNTECFFTSVVRVQREVREVPLSNDHPTVVCDEINIENSTNVHIGPKNIYNKNVIVNQYLCGKNKSILVNENNTCEEFARYEESQNNEKFESEEEARQSNKTLHVISLCFTNKECRRRRLYTILICTVILFLIPIIVLSVWLLTNSKTLDAVPSSPTSLEVLQIEDDTVLMQWKVPKSTGGVELEAYKIDINDVINSEWLEVGYVNASILSFRVEKLEMDHEYRFRIYAKNRVGIGEPIETPEPIQIEPISNPLEVISRNDWGASNPRIEPIKLQTIPAPYVIICHTVYWPCNHMDDCKTAMKYYQRDAFKKGYGDITFNFIIGGNGHVYQGRGWDIEGNHTDNFNHQSIGIAFSGNYNIFEPKAKQMESLKLLLRSGVKKHRILRKYKLLGQKQVTNNTMRNSPGDKLYDKIINLDSWVLEP